jgi:hypothetical protein
MKIPIKKSFLYCAILCIVGASQTCNGHSLQTTYDPDSLLDQSWVEKTNLQGRHSGATLTKVTVDKKTFYVVRDLSKRSMVDRKREIHAQKIASDQGYGPHLYAYDSEQGRLL